MAVPVQRGDRRGGKSNPIEGSMVVLPVQFDDIVANETAAYQWSPPAGTKLEIIGIDARCTSHAGDAQISVGSAAAGTQIVAAVTLATTLGALTLVATEITASNVLDVRLVADANDAAQSVSITVFGYISNMPDSLAVRNTGHF